MNGIEQIIITLVQMAAELIQSLGSEARPLSYYVEQAEKRAAAGVKILKDLKAQEDKENAVFGG